MSVDRRYSLDFATAWGEPVGEALFRARPEDFQVVEQLGFEPAGSGEHIFLHLEKREQNTRWVAKLLAEHFSVKESDVGYCGMKDRHAVTSQWFSVYHPGADLSDPSEVILPEGVRLLEITRHTKKLRRGTHQGNDFVIYLRSVTGDRQQLEARLERIRKSGVPNYFGEQRFGFDGGNLVEANNMLAKINQPQQHRGRGKKRQQRGGIYLSAARAYLFNLILSARVHDGSWNFAMDGEAEPTGPLWGRGRSPAVESVRTFEQQRLAGWEDWLTALEHTGLQQARRPLCLMPQNFRWAWSEQESGKASGRDLRLSFSLPVGAYATSVLREISGLNILRPAA